MSVDVQDKLKVKKAIAAAKVVVDAKRRQYEDELARQWSGLPRYVIKRFYKDAVREVGLIDLSSEVNEAFFRAIRFYKPEFRTAEGKPVQFNTYAIDCIIRSTNRFLYRSRVKRERIPTVSISAGRVTSDGRKCGTLPESCTSISYKDIEAAYEAREEITERMASVKPIHREIFLDWLGGFLDESGNERPQLSFVKLAAKYKSYPEHIKRVVWRVHEQLGLKDINRSMFGATSKGQVEATCELHESDVPDQQLTMFELAVA